MTTLSVDQFIDLLDRLGADLTHWPSPQREAAEALIASSDDAATAFAQAVNLDRSLKAASPKAPKELADRIVAKAGSEPPKN